MIKENDRQAVNLSILLKWRYYFHSPNMENECNVLGCRRPRVKEESREVIGDYNAWL